MTITRVQKQALLALGIVGILLVAYFVYLQVHFRLVSATPSKTSTSTSVVVFTFNKELAESQDVKFSIDPVVPGNVSIENKSVTFTPSQSYELNQLYAAKLQSVTAKDGSKISDIETTFTPRFTDEKDLPGDDRDRAISMTDRLEKENTILSKLPYSNMEFKVDYDIIKNAKDEDVLVLRVELYPIINRPDQYATYATQITDYKTKAIAWIDQNAGGKFYDITFTPELPDQQTPASDYTGDGVPPEQQP